ncbi:MAG: HAMP domain-containing histidine kinase, partial [Gammaproteobacteria bacterium]|nr:HAMP domain-containing histidine kinase [Gammaproteobacteria bacterium]NIQ76049.1 HAMP domain-containing histidine kinase [Gammaproteobacteria bacterium]NIR96385.1 HAMP domain-containing histidine kinase [Gammaproteobacteria bacterium]NIW39615.1 hypothetical protein [candidate division Zixibacteria bacterium]NIX57526.1 hypothetical protein [candidate division Zixibacteria bacterium]
VMKEVTGNRELYELLHKKSRAETVAEISGMIAHQIRTPLSAISIYLSRLDDSGKENINEVKEKISSNIRHLGKLVE